MPPTPPPSHEAARSRDLPTPPPSREAARSRDLQKELRMTRTHRIAVIPGDGIGPEVVSESLRILERVAAQDGFKVELTRYPFGADHYLKTRESLPESAFQEMAEHDAILLGA